MRPEEGINAPEQVSVWGARVGVVGHLWFLILATLALGPLLKPGYLLLLDAPAGPSAPLPKWAPLPSEGLISAAAPVTTLIRILGTIEPQLPNKVLIMAAVWAGGFGIYRLVVRFLGLSLTAGLLGGTLFVLNPFMYERLISGQLLFTLGCAALPWALPSIARISSAATWVDTIKATLCVAVITAIDLHVGGMSLVLLLAALAISQGPPALRLLRGTAALAGLVALNLFWILPAWLGGEGDRLGAGDLIAYAPRPRSATILWHELALHGFWRSEFATPLSHNPLLYLMSVLPIFILVLVGVAAALRDGRWRRPALALMAVTGLALVVGMGISFPLTGGLTRFLFEQVPGYGIYREPQKWIALLALAYALFAAAGLQALRARSNDRLTRAALSSLLLLIPAATPMSLWGFGGQVALSRFPDDWERAARALRDSDGRLLMLPWNLYQPLPFAGNRIVANPAEHFFPIPTLVSGDPRLPTKGTTRPPDPRDRLVSRLVRAGSRLKHFGHLVAPLGVHFVALAHVADAPDYQWVQQQSDLVPVLEGRHLSLYRNLAWQGSFLELEEEDAVTRLSAVLGTPSRQLWAASHLTLTSRARMKERLVGPETTRDLPIWPIVEQAQTPVLGTDRSCGDGWRLGTRRALCHLGAMAAFESPTNDVLWRSGLLIQVVGYAFSFCSLAALLVGLTLSRRELTSTAKDAHLGPSPPAPREDHRR